MSDHHPLLNASDVVDAFLVVLNGGEYNGPEIEWEQPNLQATCPEPHIAFSREYVEDNDIEIDAEYVLATLFQLGIEQGHRMTRMKSNELQA